MKDKQIKLDGSWIPIEEAIKAGLISEKDIKKVQRIIDGVDVSGCEYIIPPHKQCPNKTMPYAKETSCFACKEHNTKLNFCKNNPNCYYKQLKRSEAQCEAMFVTHTDLEKKYKAKEQECEELKRQIEAEQKDNWSVQGQLGEAECLLCRYDRALTEIKEIVFPKNQLIITDSPIILKIQEKISECEGNNE